MNLLYQWQLWTATLYFTLAATTVLLQRPCGAQDIDTVEAEKPEAPKTTSREDAILLAKLWTAIEGRWEYKQQSDSHGFLMMNIEFKKACNEVEYYQESTEQQFPGRLSGTVLYIASQIRPLRNDLEVCYMQSSLNGKRLVLEGKTDLENKSITIEILDADKIDNKTTQIKLRIKRSGGGNFVWYRSGKLLEFTRTPTPKPPEEESEAPQTPAKLKRSPGTFP